MEFIYKGYPYQCCSTVLPKGRLWCNADSLLYEDGLFDQDPAELLIRNDNWALSATKPLVKL